MRKMGFKFIYLPKYILKEANDASIRECRGRNLEPKWIEVLPEGFTAIVQIYFYHTKDEVRLVMYMGEEHPLVVLDISETRFKTLPRGVRNEDGTYSLPTQEELESKRPYPKGREWQESVVKKPVRRQKAFRQGVLKAYSNCCAVCSIKDTRLLRAAHIVAVVDGGPDEICNGLCLCINHEVAFDSGLLIVNEDFSLSCASNIGVEISNLRLPKDKKCQPSVSYLTQKNNKLNSN